MVHARTEMAVIPAVARQVAAENDVRLAMLPVDLILANQTKLAIRRQQLTDMSVLATFRP